MQDGGVSPDQGAVAGKIEVTPDSGSNKKENPRERVKNAFNSAWGFLKEEGERLAEKFNQDPNSLNASEKQILEAYSCLNSALKQADENYQVKVEVVDNNNQAHTLREGLPVDGLIEFLNKKVESESSPQKKDFLRELIQILNDNSRSFNRRHRDAFRRHAGLREKRIESEAFFISQDRYRRGQNNEENLEKAKRALSVRRELVLPPNSDLVEAAQTCEKALTGEVSPEGALNILALATEINSGILYLGARRVLEARLEEINKRLSETQDSEERAFLQNLRNKIERPNSELLNLWKEEEKEVREQCLEWQVDTQHPENQALGYDLERHLILFDLQMDESAINQEIEQLEKKGEGNLGEDEKRKLEALRKSRERLKEISQKRKEVKNKEGKDIPDQIVELAKKVVSATGQSLSETEQQQIADKPLDIVAGKMGDFIGDLLGDEKGREGKIDNFIQNMGITEEGQKNEIKRKINEILQMYENLKEEISQSLQEGEKSGQQQNETQKEGQKKAKIRKEKVVGVLKTVAIVAGLLAFIALLESQKKG